MSLFDGAAVQLDIFTSGGNCHLLVPHRLCRWKWNFGDSYFFLDGVFLSFLFFLCSDRKVQARQEQGERFLPVILPSVQPTVCRMTGWRRPPPWRLHRPPPPCSWKDPRKTMRFDAVIRLLRKLCFSDVIYLVLCRHPVMMTCHSSLLCALYLYMIRLLFHCISLDLSPIFFCAIPATNEKIKKRNILCAVSNTFSVA